MTFVRKTLAVVTAVCLLIGCCGCFSVTLPSFKDSNDTLDPLAYATEFQDNWRYKTLDAEMKACYGTIYTALTDAFDADETVTISQEGKSEGTYIGVAVTLPHALSDMTQSKKLYNAVIYDNPHFFYVSNVYGLEGYQKDDVTYFNKILLTYTMDADERKAARDRLNDKVRSIQQNAPKTADEFEVELYLHDQLLALCTYDHEAAKKGYSEFPHAYTAYAALVEGKAVCEGYSRAMQLLLKSYDIPCTLVIGEAVSNGEQHMWNYVSINGNDYHLDVTWDDSGDMPRHNYFNATTDQISLSHRIADGQDFIDTCHATTDNFYHRNGLYVDTYQRLQIAAIVAERIRAGETQVELLFAADKFDSALLFFKSHTATAEMVNAYLAESGHSLWEYNLYSETDEHILIIRKK